MQYYLNQACISYKELIEPGVLTTSYFKQLAHRGKLEVLRKGGNGREALIAYDSMPEDLKLKVRQVYGDDVRKKALQSPLLKYYEVDVKASDFFDTYRLENGKRLSDDKQREYTANASALNSVIRLMEANQTMRKSLGGQLGLKKVYSDFIIPALQAFKVEWGHTLPKSERQLRERIKTYREDGYKSLISGKLANENAAKIAETEQHALLRRLLSHANNFDYAQVAMMYNEVANVNGWHKVTRKTVGNFAEKNRLFTEGGRRGEVNFDNKVGMQSKRRAPGYPMFMWTVDGWDVELLYQETALTKTGDKAIRYDKRLTAVVVLDPFNKYPIGYAIGTHETPDLVRQAIRNALNHTADLFGCRYRPNQIQSDRYASKNLTPFYEAISPRYTPAKAKNAKSKVIEPWFSKALNKDHCQFLNNWSGFGVTSKKDNQPNTEWKNKIRHSFPDRKGCIQQIVDIIEKVRAPLKQQFIEKWVELPDHYKLPWTTEQYLYHAGITKERTSRMRGEGMVFDIDRVEYTYDSFDMDFRRYTHVDWTIKYDPENMGEVLAVGNDGTLRFLLEEKYIQPMALVERTDGDAKQLARTNQFKKQTKELIINQLIEDAEKTKFLDSDESKDTLSKMLLVDGQGQHKNRKNEGRALVAAAPQFFNIAPQVQPRKERPEPNFQEAYDKYLDGKVDINEYINP